MRSLPSAKTVSDSNPHLVRCNDVFFTTLNYIIPIKKWVLTLLVKHPSVVKISLFGELADTLLILASTAINTDLITCVNEQWYTYCSTCVNCCRLE